MLRTLSKEQQTALHSYYFITSTDSPEELQQRRIQTTLRHPGLAKEAGLAFRSFHTHTTTRAATCRPSRQPTTPASQRTYLEAPATRGRSRGSRSALIISNDPHIIDMKHLAEALILYTRELNKADQEATDETRRDDTPNCRHRAPPSM